MKRVVEVLCVSEMQMDGLTKDLLMRSDPNAPTFVNCRAYRMLLWTGVKTGNAPVQYTVRGGDQNGWRWTQTGAIQTGANQWFRVAIKIPRRTDWFRIEVSGVPQILRSKIVGVRG